MSSIRAVIENTVEMIAFVLDHPGVEAMRLEDNLFIFECLIGHADIFVAPYRASHARDGQARLKTNARFLVEKLDHRIHEHGQGHTADDIALLFLGSARWPSTL